MQFPALFKEHTVYISNEDNTTHGSGVLYYPGEGNIFFVFTCAHVVRKCQEIHLHIMHLIDDDTQEYQFFDVVVPQKNISYSPEEADVAVIAAVKGNIPLAKTEYSFEEPKHDTSIACLGYPFSMSENDSQSYAVEKCEFTVAANTKNNSMFEVSIQDTKINASNRVDELEGLSGSPLFSYDGEALRIYGFVSRTREQNATMGRVKASKARYANSILKQHYNIQVESSIQAIPAKEIAPHKCIQSISEVFTVSESNAWIQAQKDDAYAFCEDLKLGKVIELVSDVIKDERFKYADAKLRIELLQALTFAYRISRRYSSLPEVINLMNDILPDNDAVPFVRCTSLLESGNYEEARKFALDCLSRNSDGLTEKMYLAFCDLYLADTPSRKFIEPFINDNEELIIKPKDDTEAALCYQMFGAIYSRELKMHEKALRCLNRAYAIDGNLVVCETLACAYYDSAMSEACLDDGKRVNDFKIDRHYLYKARECFLNVLNAADDIYLEGFVSRSGVVAFNTFFFLHDTYRTLDFYPTLNKFLPEDHPADRIDLFSKYVQTAALEGNIPDELLEGLTEEQIISAKAISINSVVSNLLDTTNPNEIKNSDFEQLLKDAIDGISELKTKATGLTRKNLLTNLINMKGSGIRLFGWDCLEQVRDDYTEFISIKSDDDGLGDAVLECFVFELSHDTEMSKAKFMELFENFPSIITWREVQHFNVRHELFDDVEAWYLYLFEKRENWVDNEPEYFIRDYMDFITNHHRDLKKAIDCFVKHKDKFDDKDISAFWESELLANSVTFNDPEHIEGVRRRFYDKGLIPEEDFRRFNFVSYMLNLDSKKAWSFFSCAPGPIIPNEQIAEAQFLAWQRKLRRPYCMGVGGMYLQSVQYMNDIFRDEKWLCPVDEILRITEYSSHKAAVFDAWALFYISATENMSLLEKMDHVYVTHMTISRFLDELLKRDNPYIHAILSYVEGFGNVQIVSPDFETQLKVREKVRLYCEPVATIGLAVERNCPAVIGAYDINEIIQCIPDKIIRPNDWVKV